MKQVIDRATATNAQELVLAVQRLTANLPPLYRMDEVLTEETYLVKLVKEELTDGSFVYNLEISK